MMRPATISDSGSAPSSSGGAGAWAPVPAPSAAVPSFRQKLRRRAGLAAVLVAFWALSPHLVFARPFLTDETTLWNQSPVKRPGTTRLSRWAGTLATALPISSTTGRAEVLVRNLTDQKLCVGSVNRTSAAVPVCATAFPAGVCASANQARMMPGPSSWILPAPYSDTYGVGILCATPAAAVTNGEFVYLAQSGSSVVMLGATAPVCGNGLCEYGETALSCPADCS